MNARLAVLDALDSTNTGDGFIAALTAAGFVVVRCAPGERIAVTREAKPCERCDGTGRWVDDPDPDLSCCQACAGEGFYGDTVTVQRLEPLGWDRVAQRWVIAQGETVYRAVALPEETP